MNLHSRAPIFIVGSPRSGTTLLRFILSSHPRIHIPDETGFIPFLRQNIDGNLTPYQVRRILTRIGKLNRHWDGIVADPDRFIDLLPELTLTAVLDSLYRIQIAAHDAVRWGDKTPGYALHIPFIERVFPDAQFIHLIRDGRDAVLSAYSKWGASRWYMDPYYLLRNWMRHVQSARRAGQALGPERYLEVRYEALVSRPEIVIQEICSFLDEDLHPDMLAHTRLAREIISPAGHVEVRRPISTASVGRWQRELRSRDLWLAHRVVGSTLVELGYPSAPVGNGSIGDWLTLFWFKAKFVVVESTRRLLTRSGLLALNRGKRHSLLSKARANQ
jgi:hypothetical protein